ncbi:catalase-peroxidase [Striga asiatica]|uniref:Catalase-peroxidase n=1 Tax=Striga asiatica TaxID=4170 RepID=A0A5A7P8A0_STRAF|nr:catalase-peroxidase [Striga asiatica]
MWSFIGYYHVVGALSLGAEGWKITTSSIPFPTNDYSPSDKQTTFSPFAAWSLAVCGTLLIISSPEFRTNLRQIQRPRRIAGASCHRRKIIRIGRRRLRDRWRRRAWPRVLEVGCRRADLDPRDRWRPAGGRDGAYDGRGPGHDWPCGPEWARWDGSGHDWMGRARWAGSVSDWLSWARWAGWWCDWLSSARWEGWAQWADWGRDWVSGARWAGWQG